MFVVEKRKERMNVKGYCHATAVAYECDCLIILV